MDIHYLMRHRKENKLRVKEEQKNAGLAGTRALSTAARRSRLRNYYKIQGVGTEALGSSEGLREEQTRDEGSDWGTGHGRVPINSCDIWSLLGPRGPLC